MATRSEKKVTTSGLFKMKKEGMPIVALTAYDWTTAKLADNAGVDLLLVGDSMGTTILGYPNTVSVTLDQSLHHTAAVVRGTRRAIVIGDMPFLTYQLTQVKALENAGRYLQEAGAEGVKVEGGEEIAPTVERLVKAGIPVLGHIGLLPQSLLVEGRYRVHGRTQQEADQLQRDAEALEKAGVFGIVLEGVPSQLSKKITDSRNVPTIGIGAGPYCDGQIQVVNDLLGLTEHPPRHAKEYVQLAEITGKAFSEYIDEVKDHSFPDKEHSFE